MIEKNLLYFENDDKHNFEKKIVSIDHNQESKRLDLVLSSLYPDISRSRIQNWIVVGAATLDGMPSKSSTHVKFGQKLEINPPIITQNSEWVPELIDLNIVYEDDSILVLNKQSGLVVHPGAGNPNGTLLNGLIQYCPSLIKIPRAGLVHRLDKDTTGLLVVAKTLESHTSLVNQLLERQVSRVYIAVSWGRLKAKMEINKSLARDKYNRKKFSVSDSSFAKKSQTYIKPISYGKIESYPVSVIECKLKTGRTHQIRVHLECINFPIVGDKTYKKGSPSVTELKIQRQALHAKFLSFTHPLTNKKIEFSVIVPDDISNLLFIAGIK